MPDLKPVYLRPDVKVEPVIWQWYAWPFLISPLTAACNIVERHLKIMRSYVQAPMLHAQALKNPKMIGGPFIDLNGGYVEHIKELVKITEKDCAELIELEADFKNFERLIQKEAVGQSLGPFYQKIPYSLRGLVELVYDLNNHPSLRLIEPLIYKKYYNDKHQKIVLSFMKENERSFVLSTPKLYNDTQIWLNFPFCDQRYDKLFHARMYATSYDKLVDMFGITPKENVLFTTLFTSTAPVNKTNRDYQGEGVRIRYCGHACVLIQSKKTSILVDPVLSYDGEEGERFTFYDLPDKIDCVLLTHNHQDHILFETLLQIRHRVKSIIIPINQKGSLADPSLKLILQKIGFNNVVELNEMETVIINDSKVTGLPFFGEHADLNIYSKLAYLITMNNKKFVFCADSNNLDTKLYEYIFEDTGPIDALFLGMECDGAPLSWLYGPLLSQPINRSDDRSRTLSGSNCERAWPIIKLSQCKQIYIYAMGQEPWLNYVMALKYTDDSIQIIESNKLVKRCKESGIYAERLYGKKELIY